MKRILIAHPSEDVLSPLELILKNWGYLVTATTSTEKATQFISESNPDVLFVAEEFLQSPPLTIPEGITVIPIKPLPTPEEIRSVEFLALPVDIFHLFEIIQHHIEKIPRKNMRLDVRLPGLILQEGKSSCIGDVLSLSPGGFFARIGCQLAKDSPLKVTIPLIGLSEELELSGEIIYKVEPTQSNNYMQGIGVAFTGMGEREVKRLKEFLENRLYEDLTELGDDRDRLNSPGIQWTAAKIIIEQNGREQK